MDFVTIPDPDHGEIRLQAITLDAVLSGERWTGPGADALNAAIDQGWLPWPRCIDEITLYGQSVTITPDDAAAIDAGFPHPSCGILGQDAIEYLAKYWPMNRRQTFIPSICCFALNAAPGARIIGRLLVEIQ